MIWICDIKNVETTNIENEKSHLYKSNIVLGLSLSPGGSKTHRKIVKIVQFQYYFLLKNQI